MTDLSTVMWDYTLPDIIKVQQLIAIKGACEEANHKDEEAKAKINQHRK